MRTILILCSIFFLVFIMLSGCLEEKKERNSAESFYASGALKSKKWFWKEGVFVDTAYYYFENGKTSSIDILNDSGVLDGISKVFYESGYIYQSIPYNNGIREGFILEYTPIGNLSSKIFYLNENQIGDSYWFYENNKFSRYNFYDFKKRNLNLITYDSITGRPIKDMYQDIFIDSIIINKTKDSFKIQLLLSNPPKRRSTIRIDYLSSSGRILKSDSIIGKPYYLIKDRLNDSLKTIKYFATQYDSLRKENISQSKNINVE